MLLHSKICVEYIEVARTRWPPSSCFKSIAIVIKRQYRRHEALLPHLKNKCQTHDSQR